MKSLSLTIRGNSSIMINPPVAEDLQMREWYKNNKQELQERLQIKIYKDHDLLLPYPKSEDIISFSTAHTSLHDLRTTWIKWKLKLDTNERAYWFTACANCHKSIDANLTWIVTCPSCKQKSDIEIQSIHATICSPDVERFIPLTSVQLKEADEFGTEVDELISKSLNQHLIVAFICSYEVTFQRQTEMKVSVVKAYNIDALSHEYNLP